MKREICDFLVIGNGLAGSAAAYLLAEFADVALVAQSPPEASNSWAAQGGIAAVASTDDTPALHARDTIAAGHGLCSPARVQVLAERAPGLMSWLQELGVRFDVREDGQLAIGLEAAHSRPRIWHVGGDATGRGVLRAVSEAVDGHPNVRRWTDVQVTGLIRRGGRIIGALGHTSSGPISLYARQATILATGGIGQLYPYTTNPLGATGVGIALAYLAGAKVRNMEFVQFHPTALAEAGNPRFLISEAVRGAGGRLLDETGRPLMAGFARGDLEPRDVVARQIHLHLLKGGRVFLDTTNIPDFAARFPRIYAGCQSRGVNPTRSPIPVAPAAHFLMGGIATDLAGQTSLPGLYCIGEAANTGVHGANRLASNSLLECLLMAHELAAHWRRQFRQEGLFGQMWSAPGGATVAHSPAAACLAGSSESTVTLVPDDAQTLDAVRRILWQSAGIVRSFHGLTQGLEQLANLRANHPRSPACLVASLIIRSALHREESRGAHYRADYPSINPAWADKVVVLQREGNRCKRGIEHVEDDGCADSNRDPQPICGDVRRRVE
jgi:L-aspartate oxidase